VASARGDGQSLFGRADRGHDRAVVPRLPGAAAVLPEQDDAGGGAGPETGAVPKQAARSRSPSRQPAPKSKTTGNPELDQVLAQGQKSVAEIQALNDAIPDFKLSAQIKQLEILTDKIFAYVRQNPSKLGQIRQFLDYYLPTTIKLLRQYVELQNQGMRMGNIDEGMKKIEDMLDKIIVAFQKQLDSLFESDVVDITADIQVMENMMASQGLTDKKDF
jgi:hypothetical protein